MQFAMRLAGLLLIILLTILSYTADLVGGVIIGACAALIYAYHWWAKKKAGEPTIWHICVASTMTGFPLTKGNLKNGELPDYWRPPFNGVGR